MDPFAIEYLSVIATTDITLLADINVGLTSTYALRPIANGQPIFDHTPVSVTVNLELTPPSPSHPARLTFCTMSGVPKSAPPCSLNPQGVRSNLDILIWTLWAMV